MLDALFSLITIYRISLSIQATKSDGIFSSMSFVVPVFSNMKQMINVMIYLVIASNQLGCNNDFVVTAVTAKVGVTYRI